MLSRLTTGSPPHALVPSADRLRALAVWLDEAGSPRMAAAAREAARRVDADRAPDVPAPSPGHTG